jgi:hypothetical protein
MLSVSSGCNNVPFEVSKNSENWVLDFALQFCCRSTTVLVHLKAGQLDQ